MGPYVALLVIPLAVIVIAVIAVRMEGAPREKLMFALSRFAALAIGTLWGFFVAFNVVFSDVFGLEDRLYALLYVLVAYLVLGFAVGLIGLKTGMRWAWWLAGPGLLFVVPMVVLALFPPDPLIAYHLGVIACVVAGTFGGLFAAQGIRGLFARRKD